MYSGTFVPLITVVLVALVVLLLLLVLLVLAVPPPLLLLVVVVTAIRPQESSATTADLEGRVPYLRTRLPGTPGRPHIIKLFLPSDRGQHRQ